MGTALVTLLMAAAPGVFLLTFFYLRDRYEPEPLRHIALAFGLGMYAMVAAHGFAVAAEGVLDLKGLAEGRETARFLDAFVLSGLIEEGAKWILFAAAVYHWDEFDEPLDGVVYGVAIALGFATLENVLFVSHMGLGVALERGLFAVPAHALFGAVMGYYGGRVKFDVERAVRWRDRGLSLAAPAVFHGVYNFALFHRLDWKLWIVVSAISVSLWVFVMRRVHRAADLSPHRDPG